MAAFDTVVEFDLRDQDFDVLRRTLVDVERLVYNPVDPTPFEPRFLVAYTYGAQTPLALVVGGDDLTLIDGALSGTVTSMNFLSATGGAFSGLFGGFELELDGAALAQAITTVSTQDDADLLASLLRGK
ncbi:MAG: hypothetical protein HRU31_09595 [Rhodobacteraceae bacterium]|nr:hypothetical protein [Paracoccaceae bacterium]